MTTKYFAWIPPGRSEPTALYRVAEGRSDEAFKLGEGWAPSDRLSERFAAGEMDTSDEITPEAAADLVARWGGRL